MIVIIKGWAPFLPKGKKEIEIVCWLIFLIFFLFSVLNAKDVIPLDANGEYSNWTFLNKKISF